MPNAALRTALVTGANRGIGLGIATALAEAGLRVLLGARDRALGEEAAAALRETLRSAGGDVRACALDVASTDSIDACCDALAAEGVHVDVLVNNAAIMEAQGGRALAEDLALLRRTLETNTIGAVHLMQRLAPLMRERGYGRIVNVSSDMGSLAHMHAGDLSYRVSKAALNAATRVFADELRGTGVLVNCLNPGWVRTRMGGAGASRSLAEGADTAVWLAMLGPEDTTTGGFFQSRKPLEW
jgi:NAD(P)-dependent dehydrogenase (short-subunit alcohol dehydrogenase family)